MNPSPKIPFSRQWLNNGLMLSTCLLCSKSLPVQTLRISRSQREVITATQNRPSY